MAKSYRRRYYKRRKNSSSEGVIGAIIIVALVVYAYDIDLNHALLYAVTVGLVVFAIILIFKLWKKRQGRAKSLLMADINNMSGLDFERYVAGLLKKQGFTGVRLTEQYDLGIDIIARKDGKTWGVQVKRCSNMVKAAAVRQVVTALKHYDCDRAMVITNATYTRPAEKLANSNDCRLIGRTTLAKWMSV